MYNQQETTQATQKFHLILSQITHEIRNSTALMNGQMQLLEQEHPELCDYEGWENLTEHLEYLHSLLNEVSAYNNASHLRLETVSLAPYLNSVLKSVLPSMNYLGISFTAQIPSDLPAIALDRIKIRQALLNLLRNAQDAVSQNGAIHLEAFCKEQKLFLTVTDNGCGIEPDHLSGLFQPFVTHKENGTGLGLSIVREIIQAHGGSIEVESDLGKGSTFTVSLPLSSI